MTTNFLFPAVVLSLLIGLSSCAKDCEQKIATCSETAPTDELCQAAFNRWFYKKEQNKCEQIGYSGCSAKGFATQQECEECKCK